MKGCQSRIADILGESCGEHVFYELMSLRVKSGLGKGELKSTWDQLIQKNETSVSVELARALK